MIFENITNNNSISKTIRFKVEPIEETKPFLEDGSILSEDKKRSERYVDAKRLLDNYYRVAIDKAFEEFTSKEKEDISSLLSLLADEISRVKRNQSSDKKDVIALQQSCRKKIVECLKNNQAIACFSQAKAKEIFFLMIKELPVDYPFKAEIESIFGSFTSYFKAYCNNRANLFSVGAEDTAIANRIINENFPKYLRNLEKIERIREKHPSLFSLIRNELNIDNLESWFSVDVYTEYFVQRNIDVYNSLIGKKDDDKKGINQIINEYCSQNKEVRRKDLLLEPLYKQILSERSVSDSIPYQYKDMNELVFDFQNAFSYKEKIQDAYHAIKNISSYDPEGIFLSANLVKEISNHCYKSWNALPDGLEKLYISKIVESGKKQTKKDVDMAERYKKEKCFSLKEILDASKYCNNRDVDILKEYFSLHVDSLWSKLNESESKVASLLLDSEAALKKSESNTETMKDYLDSLLSISSILSSFITECDRDKDAEFYMSFDEIPANHREIIGLYNRVRNFLTKKNDKEKQFKVNFNCPTLANGWDRNKEKDNLCMILRKDGLYYLAIMNKSNKQGLEPDEALEGSCYYEKMVYKYVPDPAKMLPKVMFPKSGKYKAIAPPASIVCSINKKREGESEYYKPYFTTLRDYEIALIDYYQRAIPTYQDWGEYNMTFRKPEEYESLNEFLKDVNRQGYFIRFDRVSEAQVEQKVKEGSIFLFKIANKDFSEFSKGKKNLHTLYWEALFSEQNIKNTRIKLNGEAELFYRPAAKNENPVIHKKDSWLVNRTLPDGKLIPDEIYHEIYNFKNGKTDKISEEARGYLDVKCKKALYDIKKDRRFYEDQYFFHVSLTFNPYIEDKLSVNEQINNALRSSDDFNVIGIDRGERNLIYVSVIDKNGQILHQASLNALESNERGREFDYHEKLVQVEKERDKARKSWKTVGQIKDIKEGYLSLAVHKITSLMLKYNAVVVMEDLNYGFKRGRFKFERQVYTKFEEALIKKLNHLCFKERGLEEEGGMLNGYQLANTISSIKDVGRQTGALFYIPAAYTSKIDPTTGFANIFEMNDLTTKEAIQKFFSKFDSICYNAACDEFLFSFDYRNFKTRVNLISHNEWTLSSREERIIHKKNGESISVHPTEDIKKALGKMGINFANGCNIVDAIADSDATFDELSALRFAFLHLLQMRNSDREQDYIISPAKSREGEYFDSRNCGDNMPKNADANGAYNIARKGLIYINRIKNTMPGDAVEFKLSDQEWLEYAMTN